MAFFLGYFVYVNRGLVVCVFFGLFVRINNAWAPMQVPYKTFLTNGVPAGDGKIYNKFEYDDNYTINKFHRPAFIFTR